jgi:DNA-3-methyladenine glycosylase II
MEAVHLDLVAVPPFRLDLTAWVLRRRPDYRVDRWDGAVYRRAFPAEEGVIDLEARQCGTAERPVVRLTLRGQPEALASADEVVRTFRRLVGLDVDLREFYALAGRDPLLGPLVDRFRGFKPTRYPSLFECLTNAIACQQVTLSFGLQVVSRLAAAYGRAVEAEDGVAYAFPTPEAVARADPEHLREIGFSRQKARALIELAEGLSSGGIDLAAVEALPDDAAITRLTALRGVGRWTAEYTLLRGLGRYHLFPGDDVGARNALERWLGSSGRMDYDAVRSALERWHPYAGLLYFHMLLLGLDRKGLLAGE